MIDDDPYINLEEINQLVKEICQYKTFSEGFCPLAYKYMYTNGNKDIHLGIDILNFSLP